MGANAVHEALHMQVQLLEQLLDRLLDADQVGALDVVERALKGGWTVDDVRFSLIAPAMMEVGVRWERGEIGVAEEHLACSVTEWLLFRVAGLAKRDAATGRRAVVGCSEGEMHCLGARMVGHVLVEHGWRVLYVGASTPPEAWAQIVRSRRADIAVLSTTTAPLLERVGPALSAIKAARPECRTVVGGQAYWGLKRPDRFRGADVVALEARTLGSRLAA
jgi:MerR family transcriptional regulator, light-induced transcriptional regulator